MGLDIRVYRKNTPASVELEGVTLQRDAGTGEWYSATPAHFPITLVVAAQARVGNITAVAEFRQELRDGKLPVPMLSELLADGSTSGKIIAVDCVPVLLSEIEKVLTAATLSDALRLACQDIARVAHAGIHEGNPIVLV